MNSLDFGWESLLRTDAPTECALKAALFTTYDRPDERLIAEHLLPLVLKLSREPDGEGAERQYFLLELDERLKQLHDKLVVVSSTVRDEATSEEQSDSGAYGWIWRSIRHLTVGINRKAVQHAKLWMLHWGAAEADGIEYLEIVVSSANLTRAAFKGQLQAAWRGCIELHPKGSATRLGGWGILPDFLEALAESTGEKTRLDSFISLLRRAECPTGAEFVASVPGTHSRHALRSAPWGAAGLARVTPPGRGAVSASILSPYIGAWARSDIGRWCKLFDGSVERLRLVWIDKNHPWARGAKWILPATALKTLEASGARLLHLRNEPDDEDATDLFHPQHRPADDRWSHAKLYLLKRGTSRRLLLTSANFSQSAWGTEMSDGGLRIENFEFGVCVEQAMWPFDHLKEFESYRDAATVDALDSRGSNLISWANAVWDGSFVTIQCRCEDWQNLVGQILSGCDWTEIPNWTLGSGVLRAARVSWKDQGRTPSLVQLKCKHETLSIAVFDERPESEREQTVPPEVDKDLVERMRDELLFEQYGGRIAFDVEDNEDSLEGVSGEESEKTVDEPDDTASTGRSDSYAVPTFVLARRHLQVVDNWAERLSALVGQHTGDFERKVLHRDGKLLLAAFRRQVERDAKHGSERAIGAKLAAEELNVRLKHFPSE